MTNPEDWKSTLDKHLEGWRAESADARAKSESTRLRFEEELAAERKRAADEDKAERERVRREAEDEEVESKVRELLQSGGKKQSKVHAAHRQGADEKRWAAVRSAWEVAQGAHHAAGVPVQERSEFEEEEPVEVDGRDMVAGDHGGRDGNKAAEVLQVCSFLFFPKARAAEPRRRKSPRRRKPSRTAPATSTRPRHPPHVAPTS